MPDSTIELADPELKLASFSYSFELISNRQGATVQFAASVRIPFVRIPPNPSRKKSG